MIRPKVVRSFLAASIVYCLAVSSADAQAPSISLTSSLGMQRGTKAEILLTGKNLSAPTGFLTSFPAKVVIPTDKNNGKDDSKLRVQLEVAGDVPVGYYGVRLATEQGLSDLNMFCIDDLPHVPEGATNHSPQSAQSIKPPCVVLGNVDNLQSDYFKIKAKAGQRLSFDVFGRRLGSPLDPQVSIISAETRRSVAYAQDSPGLQSDARVTCTFTEDGEYLIRLKDLLNRGGATYVYRLRIGDFPCASVPLPMVAKRGSSLAVHFAGPEVRDAQEEKVSAPADPRQDVLWLSPKRSNGLHGWPVALFLSDLEQHMENEDNDKLETANSLTLPCGVTGRFEKANDRDFYVFAAKKGQKVVLQTNTLQYHSPTLVYMILRDAKGKALSNSKPEANPPTDKRIDFTVPADGNYVIEIQHLNYVGGPEQVYHLSIESNVADFSATTNGHGWDVAQGGGIALPITINRQGYSGPIDVIAKSTHPGVTGKTTISANGKSGTLALFVKEDVPVGPLPLQVEVQGSMNGKKITRLVSARAAVSESLGKLPLPPAHMNTQLALAVKPRPPFELAVQFGTKEAVPGLKLPVTLTVKRQSGLDDAIAILPPTGLPGKVKLPKIAPIAKGKASTSFSLPIDAKAPLGEMYLQFAAMTKVGKKDVVAYSLPVNIPVTRPFALKVEPATLNLKQGETGKLTTTVLRKGGYDGPITLELRNLPANVKANKITIAKGKNEGLFEINALANAAVGAKKDVNVLGVATGASNQQQASPNISIVIGKN